MADNLNIKGIREDEPPARGRAHPRGKARKPFALECRLKRSVPDSLARQLGRGDWWVWGRYTTAARRDQAHAALVKKEETNPIPRWGHWEFRKRDD